MTSQRDNLKTNQGVYKLGRVDYDAYFEGISRFV